MRRSVLALIAATLLLSSARTRADEIEFARFGDYLEALRVQTGIPGLAAAVVGPTAVLWERGFGYQDLARAVQMRPDTPMHLDGLTQVFTAAYVLECAEQGRFSLDDPIGLYMADAPEPGATFRQLLSHTSTVGSSLVFAYRPERLDPLAEIVRRCEGRSYRSATAHFLDRLAMANSVPGPDVLAILPPPDPAEPASESTRYAGALDRLATPYTVDAQRRAYPSQYSAVTLTPSTGLISTVHDFAQFDLAVRSGLLVQPETLADAWRAPVDAIGRALPHGLGWFVQSYNGDPVIWQFGTGGDTASSSLVVTLPARGVTLVLMANSTGLVKSFPLAKGDVTVSPFARIFLALFTR
jgi:CubicO group peptidase (beta-lactamase class C family)